LGKFELEFSREAAKQYRKLPREYKSLIDIVLRRFSEGLGLDLKPVKGRKDIYRVRVGKYRVLLRKFDKTVLVFKISTRGGVYK